MPFARVNDIKMFYRVFWKGEEVSQLDPKHPVMIVLHGAPGLIDHQIEVEAWQGFSSEVQVIFLDLRGCGQTEDGDLSRWSLKLCGEDLYAFSKALHIEKPIVAGVSSGGFAIMNYLENHGIDPLAIIFCNTEAKKSPAERAKTFERVGTPEAATAASCFDADPTNLEKSYSFFETCLPYFSKNSFTLTPPAKTNMDLWIKNAKEWSEIDFRESLQVNVHCPVLILAGEDDPNHPIVSAIETAASIPKQYLHFEPIQGAGAPVYQDQPEAFRQRVLAFLKQVL